MPITSRQFNLLTQMGISLWQAKHSSDTVSASSGETLMTPLIAAKNKTLTATSSTTALKVDFEHLSQQQLFKDVLVYLELSLGEVTIEDNIIKLNWLNWQLFEQCSIEINQHLLCTPSIADIQQSPSLKRQLWQQLIKHKI